MQPGTPLEYQRPDIARRRWFGSALAVLLLHWVLFFGWGLGFNRSSGYLYCRLVMPCDFYLLDTPWLLTFAGVATLLALGLFDHLVLRISRRLAVYPAVGFALTQMFALWHCIQNTRY